MQEVKGFLPALLILNDSQFNEHCALNDNYIHLESYNETVNQHSPNDCPEILTFSTAQRLLLQISCIDLLQHRSCKRHKIFIHLHSCIFCFGKLSSVEPKN
jgi:hypothetical protein